MRGRNKSIKTLFEKAQSFLKDDQQYLIGVAHANAPEEAEEFKEQLSAIFKDQATFFLSEISPALGVHTGPGLLGFGISIID